MAGLAGIEKLDTAQDVVRAALSVTQGVLRVGKLFPLIGPTCEVVSGGLRGLQPAKTQHCGVPSTTELTKWHPIIQ